MYFSEGVGGKDLMRKHEDCLFDRNGVQDGQAFVCLVRVGKRLVLE
jgi:hypothetical protein